MTELRRRMNDDMQVRGLADRTRETYRWAVSGLATCYRRSPDQISEQEMQSYLLHLIRERQRSWSTCNIVVPALRFLYHTTLRRGRGRRRRRRTRSCRSSTAWTVLMAEQATSGQRCFRSASGYIRHQPNCAQADSQSLATCSARGPSGVSWVRRRSWPSNSRTSTPWERYRATQVSTRSLLLTFQSSTSRGPGRCCSALDRCPINAARAAGVYWRMTAA